MIGERLQYGVPEFIFIKLRLVFMQRNKKSLLVRIQELYAIDVFGEKISWYKLL